MRMSHEAQVNAWFRTYQYSQLDQLRCHQEGHDATRDDDATKKSTLDEEEDDDNEMDHAPWILDPWLDVIATDKGLEKKRKKANPIVFATRDHLKAALGKAISSTDCLLQHRHEFHDLMATGRQQNRQQRSPFRAEKPLLNSQRRRTRSKMSTSWWPYLVMRLSNLVDNNHGNRLPKG